MVRVAVVGLGNIARQHINVLSHVNSARVVAGVKRDKKSGKRFCDEFAIADYFSSAADLLQWGEFDAALITVGHLDTVEVSMAILASGRPCLIEKPVGFSAVETAAVAKLAKKAGTWGMVAVNRRYYSNIRKALDLANKAGGLKALLVQQPEWIHQCKRWGLVDSVLNRYFFVNGIHLIDFMCHAAGLPEQVYALTRTSPDRRNSYDAFFEFPGKVPGHYVSQWYAPGRWTIDLFAKDLRVRFKTLEDATFQRTERNEMPLPLDRIDCRFKPGFYRQMKAFVDAVHRGRPPSSPACLLEEAVSIMKVVEAVSKAEHGLRRVFPYRNGRI